MGFLRRFLRRWRWGLVGGLAVIMIPVVVNLAYSQQPPKILLIDAQTSAQSLSPACLPGKVPGISDPATQLNLVLVARVGVRDSEYRVYNVTRNQRPNLPPFSHVVRIAKNQCQPLATNATGDANVYLHQFLPIEIARQLSLAQLQFFVDRAGGKAVFQQRLDQGFERIPPTEPVVMPEEEVWAFQQLQLTLPPNVKVVPAPANGVK